MSIRVHSWFTTPIRVHSCPFVVLNSLFVYFVCFVVHTNPFVSIRGSVFSFRVFRVFRGPPPFVSIRGSVFFRVFRVFRGSPPIRVFRGYSNLFPLEGGMCFGVYFDKLRDIDMGINLRSCQPAMAQHFLDRSQVCPCGEEMSCE